MKKSMKKIRWFSLLLTILLLSINITPVLAQDYLFQVPAATVDITINPDGTATLDYVYQFKNAPGAHAIDYVDLGLPNSNYSLSNVTANVNGTHITDIQDSPYVTPGIALGLGSNSIPAGGSGTVTIHISNVEKMLFVGSAKETEAYASFNFQPNSFDPKYVSGATALTVSLHLPPGLKTTEPRYLPPSNWPGSPDPVSTTDSEGRVVYQWSATNASSGSSYKFGAFFPARLVPASAISIAQSFTFNFSDILGVLFPVLCCGGFIGIFILGVIAAVKSANKRKLQYLPPKIAIEGHGIKRGLTAVEAAILMEQPMDKILTMILFSVLKKEAATVVSTDPLQIKAEVKQPEGLNPYETTFITAYTKTDSVERRKGLQDMMVALVQSVGEKMKGFSQKETVVYYQDIIKQAWQQIEAAKTPEVKSEKYNENMDWTMLDKEHDTRTQSTFGGGPVYMPWWWWRTNPTISHTSSIPHVGGGLSLPTGGKSTTITIPSLPGSSAAASLVGTVQGFSSKVVGDITSFTSGVTTKTNPLPVTPTSGGRSGGGGSFHCACACACAGCACACAGGGR
jgi:hypothetical protein